MDWQKIPRQNSPLNCKTLTEKTIPEKTKKRQNSPQIDWKETAASILKNALESRNKNYQSAVVSSFGFGGCRFEPKWAEKFF